MKNTHKEENKNKNKIYKSVHFKPQNCKQKLDKDKGELSPLNARFVVLNSIFFSFVISKVVLHDLKGKFHTFL